LIDLNFGTRTQKKFCSQKLLDEDRLFITKIILGEFKRTVFFTSINDIDRDNIFRQLLENISHFSNIFRLSILLPENNNDFENFMKVFSVCPVCGRKNHYSYLRKFYFNRSYESLKIKDSLMKLLESSKDFDATYYNRINIGIPCCKCFKKHNFSMIKN